MSNPVYYGIKKHIKIGSFSETPYVRIEFYQQSGNKRYYRLKCTGNSSFSPDFPTTYLYLGDHTANPAWNYTVSFPVLSVKDANQNATSIEALFASKLTVSEFQVNTKLESSATADFSSYETSADTRILTIRLDEDGFRPTWTCPTWVDLKYSDSATPGVATLTQSDQKGVQGISRIRFTFASATARSASTIASYSVSVAGGYSEKRFNTGMAILELSTYYKLRGTVEVIFTVNDTRGFETRFVREITIVPYKSLSLTVNNTHRQGGTGSTVILDFAGKWNGSLTLSCTGIVAMEEGSSSAFASLTPTLSVSGNSFSYKSAWSGVSFDSAKAYTIAATFTDTIETVTLTLPIPVGTPVLSIRDKKVGINNLSPDHALDVGGIIAQNGVPIPGFVGVIGTAESVDLNNYTDPGTYIYKADSRDTYHFPSSNSPLVLHVIGGAGYIVQKAWYMGVDWEFVRTCQVSTWSSWKQVTMA